MQYSQAFWKKLSHKSLESFYVLLYEGQNCTQYLKFQKIYVVTHSRKHFHNCINSPLTQQLVNCVPVPSHNTEGYGGEQSR